MVCYEILPALARAGRAHFANHASNMFDRHWRGLVELHTISQAALPGSRCGGPWVPNKNQMFDRPPPGLVEHFGRSICKMCSTGPRRKCSTGPRQGRSNILDAVFAKCVRLALAKNVRPALAKADRILYNVSACGRCSPASLNHPFAMFKIHVALWDHV